MGEWMEHCKREVRKEVRRLLLCIDDQALVRAAL